MEAKPKIVIIKRVKKAAGGHHGGSWKVAYADFVTAMMAFFLLMWLLSMVSPEKRAVMSLYFKQFSLFEKGGKSFMFDGSFKALSQSGGQEYYDTGDETTGGFTEEELKGQLVSDLQQKLEKSKGSILIETSEAGVRIQIVDRKEAPIFPTGSYQLTEDGKRLIKLVAATMKKLPNQIVLEGHTDSTVGKNQTMSNWELSAMRACAAKREFEADGVDSTKINRIVGYSNTAPLFPGDPDDARNRRISIVFVYNKKKPKASDNPYGWLWKPPPAGK
jgi:chemotaxis protein MotB